MASDAIDGGDLVLVLCAEFLKQDEELSDVRRAVFDVLMAEAWKIAMRSRHYLTAKCLDAPSVSAWMILYKYGNNVNFLNATSLTR
ncbi:hypothetical protein DVH05_010905 [Phytophthora capsici]|nr:hypothetical protein DVH05_010905 [Phytophthora capsici]|eukprot:jgi/Phyca11/120312/e_gw1.41.292.1